MKITDQQIRMIHKFRPEFKGLRAASQMNYRDELEDSEMKYVRDQFMEKFAKYILEQMIESGLVHFQETTEKSEIFPNPMTFRIEANFLIPNPEFIENLLPNLPVK